MAKKENVGAVVVAAGSSRRMNGQDKILALLAGRPVLLHSLRPFLEYPGISRIVLVLNRSNLNPAKAVLEKAGLTGRISICLGGKRRQDSTLNGLIKLGECDWVIIHDCARPLVTPDLIERGLEAARETGAAIAAIPVTDTMKLAGKDMIVRRTLLREGLWQVQTPQVFRSDIIKNAFHSNETDVTDEAQLVELTGMKVRLYPGAYDNIKITMPSDLVIAEALLKQRKM